MQRNYQKFPDKRNRLLLWAEEQLIKNSVQNPRLNAEIIFSDILDIDRYELYLKEYLNINDDQISDLYEKINDRSQGIPTQYITNNADFYDFSLYVDKGVLIPRPETELLCENAISYIKEKYANSKTVNIIEIGIGSGAISIALARNIENARIYGVDISKDAIRVAKKNIYENSVNDRVSLINSDTLNALNKKFDVIISNPPYLMTHEIEDLPLDVRYEPECALDGGEDGLLFYREIINEACNYLNDCGVLMFEIHEDKAEEVIDLGYEAGFNYYELYQDYCDKDRILFLKRQ